MKSAEVKAFFSCSFSAGDREVNSFFRAICEGLDISCANVDHGGSEVPPAMALQMIESADIVIAVATIRDKIEGKESFRMPSAVSQEIAMAFGKAKPTLVFAEDGVQMDGFSPNFGTYQTFSRSKLFSAEFLRRAIASIHSVKLGGLTDHELLLSQETTDFIAEEASHLFELKADGQDFYWYHATQRSILVVRDGCEKLPIYRWSEFPPPSLPVNACPMNSKFELVSSSRPLNAVLELQEVSPLGVIGEVRLSPPARKGDRLTYDMEFSGRYLAPVKQSDVGSSRGTEVFGRNFLCYEGIVPVNRAREIELHFRFPREYKIDPEDVEFFVASFSHGIDYIVESEISRAEVKKSCIAGSVSFAVSLKSPLLRHVYGVAWNPPS
ncbi:hypothetical protein [Aquimonas voraii]|uniref:TIR domain-containing protein n=1 Tax=Aquimonas voraii TaxID=265719 RepID=A0A1G6Z997_9GAMM|nr:hypothetical protein [Aquimonas voraii]SDD99218.1 hypothetical protein SAMN04488509_1136 [Aquimonas voraii]